ncbi:DUF87 domain-containing protein [Saccharopolyspora sp. ID03-671]|uniref:VirB4 family type IV secretion system protein n=1 Tax=Saccharopolyspora sp. ID03-671 TaxID=3073066 RepID=UPI00324AA0BA
MTQHHASVFTPDSMTIGARHLTVAGEWVASFAITGYPREVNAGWLQPLLNYPGRLDVSLHIDPVDPAHAAKHLKQQLAKLESGRRHTAEHGRLVDPHVEAATEDAYDLSARIARGESKMFRLGLYLTVHAHNEQHLADEVTAVRALASSMLLDAKPTTYRSVQGWTATLPVGLDPLGMQRTFDTHALATAFPFTSPDLPAADPADLETTTDGVLYGYNAQSSGLVHWDRFAADNHNAVVLGRSGAGKSYLVKLELLRHLYRGVQASVIDPEDEYTRLADAVGGTVLRLGAPGVALNPFDLPVTVGADGRRSAPSDALARRSLFLHTVLSLLLGSDLSSAERGILDEAIAATYRNAGITTDPRTWSRPAPLLADLRDTLHATGAAELAERLRPFVDGAFNTLFNGPTTTRPDGHLVVYSLRDLPPELQAIGTALTLDAIWREVSHPVVRRRRLVVVDEAWLLMRHTAGAEFLFRMAKAARKHWCGLTVATQDVGDLLGSDLGKAIVGNATTQILLRQSPQAIDEVVAHFGLAAGARQFLLAADQGQALLSTGSQWVALQTVASPVEHDLVTTDPEALEATTSHGDIDDWIDL